MENIKGILKEIRPEINFYNSSHFIEDGLLDSLDIIQLVSELEKQMNITINGDDMEPNNFKNFGSILALIKKSPSKT